MRLFWILPVLANVRAASWSFQEILVGLIGDAIEEDLYPPMRLTMHLCLDPDQAIKLSRRFSRATLTHRIENYEEDYDQRIYDRFEHENLHVLDMACPVAFRILQTANSNGMFGAPTKWLLLMDQNLTKMEDLTEMFSKMSVYPDSDVVLGVRIDEDLIEISSIYRPSPHRSPIIEIRGNWTTADGLTIRDKEIASRRRMNLRQSPIKICLVVTSPDTVNHLTDFHDKHIDPFTKAMYPWMVHLTNRMNATMSYVVEDTWGYKDENGTWNGMIGMLQRREIDIGGAPTFLTPERLGVVDYVQLFTLTWNRFIFQKPLLSTVSNIFTLPFERSVWVAIGVFLLLTFVMLCVSAKWEYRRNLSSKSADYFRTINPAEQTVSDNFFVILGAVAQQGYPYEPSRISTRIVTLMLLIAVLSLYASYTANIVALLQSTTDSIRTPADLLNSPLKLGAQDFGFYRHYFKSFEDPVRKAIALKVESEGESAWMSLQEGTRRIREELFAFHGEVGAVYQIMQETYQEDEKCGISEIDVLNVIYPLLVVQLRSPYLEIIKNGALLLRETGLKYREENRLYTKKPVCQGQTNFISIGLTEAYFALVTLGYGAGCSVLVFVLELLWYKRQKLRERPAVEENLD